MHCKKCGNPLDDEATFCPVCGEGIIPKEEKSTPIEIASLVCGILSLVLCGLTIILSWEGPYYIYVIFSCIYPALAISAIVCGAIALAKHMPKRGYSVTGLICGCVVVITKIWLMLILISFALRTC